MGGDISSPLATLILSFSFFLSLIYIFWSGILYFCTVILLQTDDNQNGYIPPLHGKHIILK